jgi:hypothetical protein
MSDELDGQLLRLFADSQRPLADAQFVAQLSERLGHASAASVLATLRAAFGLAFRGMLRGAAAPLRLRYAGLVALTGAALSLLLTLA